MKRIATIVSAIALAAFVYLFISTGEPSRLTPEIEIREPFRAASTLQPLVGSREDSGGVSRDASLGVSGDILCYYSDLLVTGYSAWNDDSGDTTLLGWSVQERTDLTKNNFIKSNWVFTTSFSIRSIDSICGDQIAVLGVDSKNKTVLESWYMKPADGGMAAGSWAYPPSSQGFSAEFTTPTTVMGGGPFMEPGKRKEGVIAKRVEVMREDLGMAPVSMTAYPDGETFFILLRASGGGSSKIVKLSATLSAPVVVTDVATSTAYPSLNIHDVLEVRALWYAKQGYLVTLSGGFGTDQSGAQVESDEILTFEDSDGDGHFEVVVNLSNEQELLAAYEGQMIMKEGPLFQ